ncbi:16S rRNA (cytosine(967)-C(5))-methyltransferase RsmB [Edaphobacillus lindanitolerans]|uniref:16S rRNA (cytosine(967)-C(5))-methyltransferase n=1 Tax=Edaphobacillus lindanitolerans TaxID=550447 RepID=A0A1U7PLR4_9BACI|nr:16S rRNA (cytosine(967)-C(5))-methyltransferase RsmB [Edaphobacillus lindanitolerans]SIT67603.1 16S rRNA (cytosine967-C5)-methyltransferase [Edaphobacillus lindanitolerans]
MSRSQAGKWEGNVRDAALSILVAVSRDQAYSNLLLHRTIEDYKLDAKDRALLTELTYGTIQHRMTLDYYLAPFIRGEVEGWVRELLRLSVYQLVYLERIPDHAVVNEAVEIAKRRGHKGIASMVNGILRSVIRNGVKDPSEIRDWTERTSVSTSHPEWLIRRWAGQYGTEETEAMAAANNEPPVQTVRVNRTKGTADDALQSLRTDGFDAEPSPVVPGAIRIRGGNAARSRAFGEGLVTIQDESSMLPAIALDARAGMRVLDMCAAPGGKTTHIAELMDDRGEVLAYDLHPHKVKLIEENAARLGLNSIRTGTADSRKLAGELEAGSFDRILVDAPCSGLGVIRRKPDIKYSKSERDIAGLPDIQLSLLGEAHSLLRAGGILVYSTCTVDREENRETAGQFLEQFPDMERLDLEEVLPGNLRFEDGMLQVLPQDFGGDGFFVAAFRKRTE